MKNVLPIKQNLLRPFFLFLILAAFAWRLHHLDFQSLWRDEVDSVYFALRNLSETVAMFVQPAQNGVLYWLLLRVWFHLVGSSEFALRFPSVVAGTLTLPLLWQLARFWTNQPTALLVAPPSPANNQPAITSQASQYFVPLVACLLLAFNPYHLWYSQEGKMYAINTMMTLLASWCWLRAISHGGWRLWLSYLAIVSLAMYIHLLMILLIPLHLLWFVILWPASNTQRRGYQLVLAGLTLPYLPMVWWQWRMLVATEKLTGFAFVPLPEMLKTLALNYSYGFAPHFDLIWLAPLIFLALAGVLLGTGELQSETAEANASPYPAPWRRFLLLLTWITLPVIEIYLLSLRQAVYADRYVIWILPALVILLALGAATVRNSLHWVGTILATLLVFYVVGFGLYHGWQQKTETIKFDLRAAVDYIEAQRQPDSLLILQIPHNWHAYAYFTSDQGSDLFADAEKRLGNWKGGLWTNHLLPDPQALAQANAEMRAMTAGASDFWVLLSEVEMWDQRHLMIGWLDAQANLLEQKAFYGVEVRHYQSK